MHKYPLSRFKSFRTRQEAVSFLENTSGSSSSSVPPDGDRIAVSIGRAQSSERGKHRNAGAIDDSLDRNREVAVDPVPTLQSSLQDPDTGHRVLFMNPCRQQSRRLGPIRVTRTALSAGTSSSTSSRGAASVSKEPRRSLQIYINFDGGSRGNPGIAGGTLLIV